MPPRIPDATADDWATSLPVRDRPLALYCDCSIDDDCGTIWAAFTDVFTFAPIVGKGELREAVTESNEDA